MKSRTYAIKGDICFSTAKNELYTYENHYLICRDGLSAGVFKMLPEQFASLEVYDCTGLLVVPGLVDLHIHAPQFTFRGLGMDDELMEWLNNHAFPAESKYSDLEYAEKAYTEFADKLKASATTRACIFATVHVPATELLMELMEKTGLHTYIGKVNMDRNCLDYLVESTDNSISDTEAWAHDSMNRFDHTKAILTPRFLPTCSDELMRALRKIQEKCSLPLQSHISENPAEIELVKSLYPNAGFYGDAYDSFGLFGKDVPTIMAHCVYSDEEELERMKTNGVFVAHCPLSNLNLASGVAPARSFLDMGIRCGLGTDVAGGYSESIFRAMADAVQMSKIRWRLLDKKLKPLSFEEAFWLGTKGGGEFFGRVGSFEEGFEFDAVVIDDAPPKHFKNITLKERLERYVYLSTGSEITHKFISGTQIF